MDNKMESTYLIAARAGDYKDVVCCIDKLDDVNVHHADGWTALHYAVYNGNLRITRLLLQHPGIDVNARTLTGTTPLQLALRRQGSDMVNLMIEYGCSRATIPPAERTAFQMSRSLSCQVQEKLLPSWAPIWTPSLHRRYPKDQRQICFLLMCANYIQPEKPFFGSKQWVYLPSPVLHRIFEFYLWLE
ncbi:hypothetical protein THRCLA_01968 [Thraustotheca clavata]|uniref:Uncharacterized protein n=1 Tax=Thraustotheca clavata TaxID=74557 RepID=A0A1W0A6N2_9STRA|nr:hypothetical protein THRCLA_01968 [Thraustotheca clavata]